MQWEEKELVLCRDFWTPVCSEVFMLRLWALRRSESWVVKQPKQEQLCGYDEQWFRNLPKYQFFSLQLPNLNMQSNSPLSWTLPSGRCQDVCGPQSALCRSGNGQIASVKPVLPWPAADPYFKAYKWCSGFVLVFHRRWVSLSVSGICAISCLMQKR